MRENDGDHGDGRGTDGLFDPDDAGRYADRWDEIQRRFVDEPRASVAAADDLVDEVVNAIIARLTERRERLEEHWQRDDDVSTEDLRQSLRSYRELFERLLSERDPSRN